MFSTILRHKNYRQLTASLQPTCVNSDLCTVTNAYQRRFQAAANWLAAWKWVVDISATQHSLERIIPWPDYTRYSRIIHSTMLKPTHIGRKNNYQLSCWMVMANGYCWLVYMLCAFNGVALTLDRAALLDGNSFVPSTTGNNPTDLCYSAFGSATVLD